MPYDLFEHRHRFAVWAAARAAQRGLTTVENLRDALEATDIRDFLLEEEKVLSLSDAEFDRQHRSWCNGIVGFLQRREVQKATYGRAAKLVAVYLKSMIVMGPHGNSALAAVVHPPIDRNLLQNLARSPAGAPSRRRLQETSWTELSETTYFQLLRALRRMLAPGHPWWMLEEHWTVTY
jgi:hypothetical protein